LIIDNDLAEDASCDEAGGTICTVGVEDAATLAALRH
jgi:hypothetical protein